MASTSVSERTYAVERDPRPGVGVRCVATHSLPPGVAVLVEYPTASTDALADPEWELTTTIATSHPATVPRLLQLCGGDTDADASPDSPSTVKTNLHASQQAPSKSRLAALADKTGIDARQIESLWNVVCRNAFALETPVLGIEYGAALYTEACRFNHSCDPNCVSIRVGGSMAIFTCKPIHVGDELTHSYLPLRLLVQPASQRRSNLNFLCECHRCKAELAVASGSVKVGADNQAGSKPGGVVDVDDSHGLSWPDEFAASDAGKAVAAFKIATIAGSGSVMSPDTVLEMGHAAISSAVDVLAKRPLAVLDLCPAYLAAFWRAPQSQGAGHAGAAARLYCGAIAALAEHSLGARIKVPPIALELLGCCAGITAYVVPGARLRENSVPSLLASLQRLRAAFGGTFEFLRDDANIVRTLSTPSLHTVVEEIERVTAARSTGTIDVDGFARDHCAWPPCATHEGAVAFRRCSRCKSVKYCSTACQKAAWRAHKVYCHQ